MQRHGAVMSDANRKPFLVQQNRQVLCRDTLDGKADDSRTMLGTRPPNRQPFDLFQTLHQRSGKHFFMACYRVQRNGADIVDRRTKTNRLDNWRRARLKFCRKLAGGEPVGGDFVDHAAATKKRRHGFQEHLLAPQDSDARGP